MTQFSTKAAGTAAAPRRFPCSTRIAIFSAAVVGGVWGCRNPVDAPKAEVMRAQLTPTRVPGARPDEQYFRSIAMTLSGFAGYYYVPGTNRLIIAMSDNTPPDSAIRTVIRTFKRLPGGRFGPPTFEVRRARFPFTSLERIRDEVESATMAAPGVNWLDLDEAQNRLMFGVSNNGAAVKVAQLMEAAGAPVGSYGFVLDMSCDDAGTCDSDEVAPGVAPPGNSLRSYHRPAEAGMQITIVLQNPTRELACTLGFTGYAWHFGNSLSIVAASHCSAFQGGNDYQTYYQPDTATQQSLEGFGFFAQEQVDPTFPYCANSTTTYCRRADALIAFPGTQTFTDRIARTQTYAGPGMGTNGSIMIDANSPYFTIYDEEGPVMNEALDKVGRTTGWTYGIVNHTCTTVRISNAADGKARYLTCQGSANYQAFLGDSGAPVFRWQGDNTAILIGFHWGRHTNFLGNSDFSWFTSYWGMEGDLGPVELWHP